MTNPNPIDPLLVPLPDDQQALLRVVGEAI